MARQSWIADAPPTKPAPKALAAPSPPEPPPTSTRDPFFRDDARRQRINARRRKGWLTPRPDWLKP